MAKILICDKMDQKGIDGLKALGHDVLVKTGMTPDELKTTIKDYECAVVRSATKITKDVIDSAPNLKLIIRGGVGVDNIDVEHAKSKGIEVKNTPGASSRSVAELALGHIFSVYRYVAASTWRMRKGDDFKAVKKEYEGRELGGKTLGIIGIGRIGKELAQMAIAIGMNVIAYDPIVKDPGINGVKMVSLDELLKNADIISLHVPKVDKPILGKEEFAKMKDGAVVINTARGGVVDEDALLEALNSGKLYGAGIDVFVGEPSPKPELVNHPKVSVTPHLGASTHEAQDRIGAEVVTIVKEFFK